MRGEWTLNIGFNYSSLVYFSYDTWLVDTEIDFDPEQAPDSEEPWHVSYFIYLHLFTMFNLYLPTLFHNEL